MSLLGILGSVAATVAGVATANPALIAAGVSSGLSQISSGSAQSQINQGIDTAVADTSAASKEAAGILDTGYDASRDAKNAGAGASRDDKIAALVKVGALTQEQLQTINTLIQQGQTDYIDTMITNAEQYAQGMGDGGAAYRSALGEAGAGFENALNLASSQYGDQVTQLAQQLGVDYQTAAGIYAKNLSDSADKYTQDLVAAATEEAQGLQDAAKGYAGTRMQGADAVASQLDPYKQGRGTPALDYLNGLMNADPTKLDPQQQLLREKALRDSTARLAASSLRGSGRAGVAVVNNADMSFLAQMYEQNRNVSITAANQLATMGQSASSQIGAAQNSAYTDIAGNNQNAKVSGLQAIASAKGTGATYGANSRATGMQAIKSATDAASQAKFQTGQDVAQKQLDADQKVADTQLGLSKDAATTDLNLATKVADNTNATGKAIADQGLKANAGVIDATNAAYGSAGTIAGKMGDVNSEFDNTTAGNNADAISGKASADAGAVLDPALIAAQGTIAKSQSGAQTTGSQIGSLTPIISAGINGIFSKSPAASYTPASNPNPIIYT